jgi:hypothetical protein
MIVYVIIPVFLVGSLNCFVFLIPASAGERTSVAVTAFLAFVVFMTMVNGIVPASSDPVAYLFFYMLFLLAYSGAIMIMSILSLQIYEREGNIPSFIRKAFICRKKKGEVAPLENVTPVKEMKLSDTDQDDEDDIDAQEVTWKDVGLVFDRFCFISLLITYMIYSAIVYAQVTTDVEADGHV